MSARCCLSVLLLYWRPQFTKLLLLNDVVQVASWHVSVHAILEDCARARCAADVWQPVEEEVGCGSCAKLHKQAPRRREESGTSGFSYSLYDEANSASITGLLQVEGVKMIPHGRKRRTQLLVGRGHEENTRCSGR